MEQQPDITRRRTCAVYAGDMHALELHMLEAFERQVSITQDFIDANLLVHSLVATSKRHATVLNGLVNSLGDVEKIVTDKLKSAVAGLFGLAAGFVDTVRTLAISKALRDDYTALQHAIVGYVLLCTTATALKNEDTRLVAEECLADYIDLSQRIMSLLPTLALRDLADEGILLLDANAAQLVKENKRWGTIFRSTGAKAGLSSSQTTASLPPIILERTETAEGTITGQIEAPLVEIIKKPVIIEETFRQEKIVEVQPVIHREIRAPEIHHIEKHIFEKVETRGPTVVTNKPIIEETIRPVIVEEVQEIIHRELPAPVVERVEKLIDEVEIMPTVHTKEVILENEEHILKTDILVKEKLAPETAKLSLEERLPTSKQSL